MSRFPLRCFALLGLLATVLAAVPALIAQAPNQPVVSEKITRFIRDRFQFLTQSDDHDHLRDSDYPDFLVTTITATTARTSDRTILRFQDMRYLVEETSSIRNPRINRWRAKRLFIMSAIASVFLIRPRSP